MRVAVEPYWTQKSGNKEGEYEDSCWPQEPELLPLPARVAVADGATETSFSGAWAELLVRGFGTNKWSADDLIARLPSFRTVWKRFVSRKPLPWYAEQKLDMGAFAAVVGVQFDPGEDSQKGSWHATAIGDCCVFQVRGESLLTKFPMDEPLAFENRPLLLSTNPATDSTIPDALKHLSGEWQLGDQFFLMSDALACWFLKRWGLPNDGGPLSLMLPLPGKTDFERFVALHRADSGDKGIPLKNDDVTLLICTIVPD